MTRNETGKAEHKNKMTSFRAISCLYGRKGISSLLSLGVVAFLAQAALPAQDAFAASFTFEATEVSVSASGSLPGGSSSASLQYNGASASIYRYGGSSFYGSMATFSGPPSSVTGSLTISVPRNPGMVDTTYDTATISITSDLTSAFTQVTAYDPERAMLGNSVILSADGSSSAADINLLGEVTTTTIGDPTGRNRDICANFSSGVQFCLKLTLLHMERPEPRDEEEVSQEQEGLINANYVDAIRLMTEQMTVIMLHQLQILGTFFDAKNQLETQRLFGLTSANAHRDYHPSEQLCAFGSLIRSTSLEKYSIKDNVLAMNSIFQKRELLNANTSASWGPFSDIMARREQFKTIYCDANDNNQALPADFCDSGASDRKNNDLNYRRTLGGKLTLDINYAEGGAPTADEEDILALAKNLYAHQTLPSIPKASLERLGSFREFNDTRMLVAMRSVARYSFSSIASMRMEGSGVPASQLQRVMENIGVPADDVAQLIGANPSYFAQMEILTQKIFQDPSFVVGLYSGPANVTRMGLVLQGIRIMADRDKLETSLRREMLLSLILEMKIREKQDSITDKSY